MLIKTTSSKNIENINNYSNNNISVNNQASGNGVLNSANTSVNAAKIVAAAGSTKTLNDRTVEWAKFILLSIFTAGIYTVHYFYKRISNLQDENRAQALDLTAKDDEVSQLKRIVTELGQSLEGKFLEAASIKEEKECLSENNASLNKKIAELNNDKQQLQGLLNYTNNNIQALQQIIDGLNTEAVSAASKTQSTAQEIAQLSEINATSSKKVATLNNDKQELQGILNNKEEAIQALQQKIDELSAEATSAAQEKTRLAESITQLKSEQSSEIKIITNDYDALIKEKDQKILEMKRNLEHMTEALKKYKSDLIDHKKTIDQLNDATEQQSNIIEKNAEKIRQLEAKAHKDKETIESLEKRNPRHNESESSEFILQLRDQKIQGPKKDIQTKTEQIATLQKENSDLCEILDTQMQEMNVSFTSHVEAISPAPEDLQIDEDLDKTIDTGVLGIRIKESKYNAIQERQKKFEEDELNNSNVSDSWQV